MGDHPNAMLAQKLFQAMADEDVETVRAMLADDIKWHTIGGPTIEGLEQLQSTMMGSDFSIDAEVHDVVANDDHIVVLVNATATAGDQTLSYRTAEIAHVENGKITERWAFSDDTQRITDWFAQFA